MGGLARERSRRRVTGAPRGRGVFFPLTTMRVRHDSGEEGVDVEAGEQEKPLISVSTAQNADAQSDLGFLVPCLCYGSTSVLLVFTNKVGVTVIV